MDIEVVVELWKNIHFEYFATNGANSNTAAAQVNATPICYKDASFFGRVFNLTIRQLKV